MGMRQKRQIMGREWDYNNRDSHVGLSNALFRLLWDSILSLCFLFVFAVFEAIPMSIKSQTYHWTIAISFPYTMLFPSVILYTIHFFLHAHKTEMWCNNTSFTFLDVLFLLFFYIIYNCLIHIKNKFLLKIKLLKK